MSPYPISIMNVTHFRTSLRWVAGVAVVAALLSGCRPPPPRRTPPECRTVRSLIVDRSTPIPPPLWAFVMNFDKLDGGGNPIGCILVYRNALDSVPDGFVPVTCTTEGRVVFDSGKAMFDGGSVTCPVKLDVAISTLSVSDPGSFSLRATTVYTNFSFFALGTLQIPSPPAAVNLKNNPVLYYQPISGSEDFGLWVPPFEQTWHKVYIRTRASGDTQAAPERAHFPSDPYLASSQQVWAASIVSDTITHWLAEGTSDGGARGVALPQPGSRFAMPTPFRMHHQGKFIIGASPYGPPLYATLDEVVVDPGDGKPPADGTR